MKKKLRNICKSTKMSTVNSIVVLLSHLRVTSMPSARSVQRIYLSPVFSLILELCLPIFKLFRLASLVMNNTVVLVYQLLSGVADVLTSLLCCRNIIDIGHTLLCMAVGGLESLSSLHTLILTHNQLITTKLLSEAPAVQVLNVSHNHLPILDGVSRLPLLQSLDARDNNLLSVSMHSLWLLLAVTLGTASARTVAVDK